MKRFLIATLLLSLAWLNAEGSMSREGLLHEIAVALDGTASERLELSMEVPTGDMIATRMEIPVTVSGMGYVLIEARGLDGRVHGFLEEGQDVLRVDISPLLRSAQKAGAAACGLTIRASDLSPELRMSFPVDIAGRAVIAHLMRPEGDHPEGRTPMDGTQLSRESTPQRRPTAFRVHAFPNPFNPRTVIRAEIPSTCRGEVAVFDLRGQRIRTLHRGELEAGIRDFVWEGLDDRGAAVSSGVYLYRVQAGESSASGKIALLK